MAIQVTGLFKNPSSNAIFENPILVIVPHLLPYGNIAVDVNIQNEDQEQQGAFPYYVDRETIQYDSHVVDPQDQLIDGIQKELITYLPTTNDINQNSTYATFKPAD